MNYMLNYLTISDEEEYYIAEHFKLVFPKKAGRPFSLTWLTITSEQALILKLKFPKLIFYGEDEKILYL